MVELENISAMALLVVRHVIIEKHYRGRTPSNQLEIDVPQKERVLLMLHSWVLPPHRRESFANDNQFWH